MFKKNGPTRGGYKHKFLREVHKSKLNAEMFVPIDSLIVIILQGSQRYEVVERSGKVSAFGIRVFFFLMAVCYEICLCKFWKCIVAHYPWAIIRHDLACRQK